MFIETMGGGLTQPQVEAVKERWAEEKEKQRTCTHEDFQSAIHGRCCPTCGKMMIDFGD